MTRRRFLLLGAAGGIAVGAGGLGYRLLGPVGESGASSVVGAQSARVRATEASRHKWGRVIRQTLHAQQATIDLAGSIVTTWAFNGGVPGPLIRVSPGDELRVRLVNDLPASTTVHWHGIALRNDMDGVPGLTMDPVPPKNTFDYSFIVPDAGTYWYHPHVGVQLDTGLQGALIVDDPTDPGAYDHEAILILDDWTDGLGDSPSALLARLREHGMDMSGMSMGQDAGGMDGMVTDKQPLGADTGDVAYPVHLINGRPSTDPLTVRTGPGQRIRFRVINAGSDTAYRFAIGNDRLLVTHADGFEVDPVEVDALIIGMGERYDVVVTVGDGAFPIVAMPEGKSDPAAVAVLRTGAGARPNGQRLSELSGRLLTYHDLVPAGPAALSQRTPDRRLDVTLEMADQGRRWLINGATYADNAPLLLREGERLRLNFRNKTMMFHPMHLHGHTFAVVETQGPGVRKDTVNVLPMRSLSVDLEADNPGQWLLHCHNVYHGELGMMAVMSYLA